MIHQTDATRPWPALAGSAAAIVTSPPYFGLRSYGSDEREIGRQSLDTFLVDMGAVAREAWNALRDDGVMWLNIGDTASGSGGAGGDWAKSDAKWKQGESGLAPGQWCRVPDRVAGVFQDHGWRLRADIIWDKGVLRPESLDRCRRPGLQYEHIFMFVKDKSYRFWADRLEERGNIWHFGPKRGKATQTGAFPDDLPRRCILPSTEPGDIVIDPFAGSGTTLRVADELGRQGIGLDLYAGQALTLPPKEYHSPNRWGRHEAKGLLLNCPGCGRRGPREVCPRCTAA